MDAGQLPGGLGSEAVGEELHQCRFVQGFGQGRMGEHHQPQVFGTAAKLHGDCALLHQLGRAVTSWIEADAAMRREVAAQLVAVRELVERVKGGVS